MGVTDRPGVGYPFKVPERAIDLLGLLDRNGISVKFGKARFRASNRATGVALCPDFQWDLLRRLQDGHESRNSPKSKPNAERLLETAKRPGG